MRKRFSSFREGSFKVTAIENISHRRQFRNIFTSQTQSRQNAKLFSSRRNWVTPPTPHPQASVLPNLGSGVGGRGTRAGERGVGRVPIPTRGHSLWYSVNIRTLWSQSFIIKDAAAIMRTCEMPSLFLRLYL